MSTIGILGWGSLIWDERPEFDAHHGDWQADGPELPIEFSRVSWKTRGGALTLVIDERNGAKCIVSYAISTRVDPKDAIGDLRSREGTTHKNIGVLATDGSGNQCSDATTASIIEIWAKAKGLDVVVWTDLRSNFDDEVHKPFSVANAMTHLKSLSPEIKDNAASYVRRAPVFVQTPLRAALEAEPWFNAPAAD